VHRVGLHVVDPAQQFLLVPGKGAQRHDIRRRLPVERRVFVACDVDDIRSQERHRSLNP